MLEIEVKAKIDNMEDIEQKLMSLGCVFTNPIEQKDKVFILEDKSLLDLLPGDNALRIRISTQHNEHKILFTIKQQTSNPLVKQEKEVYVNDAEEMEAMIVMMGYKECSYLEKTRKKCIYKDIEICLDNIPGLGSFIELETQRNSEDATDNIQDELFLFLETLGISRSQRVTKGYDILLHEKLSIN